MKNRCFCYVCRQFVCFCICVWSNLRQSFLQKQKLKSLSFQREFFFIFSWLFWPGQHTFFDALARVGTYRHISQHPQLVTGLKNAISLCITHRHILVAHAHHLKIDSNFHNVCHENAIDFGGVWGVGCGV